MFTIKFFSFYGAVEQVEVNLCCPHYEVYTHKNGVKSIILYKDFLATEGVTYWVTSEEQNHPTPHYHVCYVENSAGKTINKF